MPHSSQSDLPRIAIIGAGPAGLEAALYARALGWRVHLFEREPLIAWGVRAWGHVSMFSAWGELRTPLGEAAAYKSLPRSTPPAPALFPKGDEYVSRYLEPLARTLHDCLHTETRVMAAGRAYLFPRDCESQPERRRERRFRLLTRSPREERVFSADYLLDASGVSHSPNWLGAGGLPALGEMGSAGRIRYDVPDVLGRDRIHFLGKHILLVGDGPSAATVAAWVRDLIDKEPSAHLLWAVSHGRALPLPYRPHDPIPRRDLLYQKANLVVAASIPHAEYLPRTQVDGVSFSLEEGRFYVTLQSDMLTRRVVVDTVVGCVGAKPTSQTWESMLSPAEEGMFVLGAKAVRPGGDVQVLSSLPEQIRAAFASMTGDHTLNLYAKRE